MVGGGWGLVSSVVHGVIPSLNSPSGELEVWICIQALETILCEKPSINAIYRKASNIDFLKKKIFNEFSWNNRDRKKPK